MNRFNRRNMVEINHPVYKKALWRRPFYYYEPTMADFRPSIATWQNERLPLFDRVKMLESRLSKLEYLLDKYGVKDE